LTSQQAPPAAFPNPSAIDLVPVLLAKHPLMFGM